MNLLSKAPWRLRVCSLLLPPQPRPRSFATRRAIAGAMARIRRSASVRRLAVG